MFIKLTPFGKCPMYYNSDQIEGFASAEDTPRPDGIGMEYNTSVSFLQRSSKLWVKETVKDIIHKLNGKER